MKKDFKYPIPDFLKEGYRLTEATIRPKGDRDLDKLLKAAEAKGYVKAVADLRKSFIRHSISPVLLLGIEPAMRDILLKVAFIEEASS